MAAVVRVIDASLGSRAQVRLSVDSVSDPEQLRTTWASSGAMVERLGDQLHAISTVVALERAAGRCLPPSEAGLLEQSARDAVRAWTGPTPPLRIAGSVLECVRPAVMGVCNVTPDSFYDGGVVYPDGHPDAAVSRARGLARDGAALVDVGGESSRPGSAPVPVEEELDRVLPVVSELAGAGIGVSIDTTKAKVAGAAIDAGARVVNDVSGGNPALLEAVAASDAGYVLMHVRGTPADMQQRTTYDDVVAEVYGFLAEGIARCEAAGIERERVAIDPGIGFAKTPEQSVALLRAIPQLRGLGRPVLIGASRKSFLRALHGGESSEERLEASLAAAALAAADGAAILRVHDVAETVRAVDVAIALRREPVG